jgi:hypothetical protein
MWCAFDDARALSTGVFAVARRIRDLGEHEELSRDAPCGPHEAFLAANVHCLDG